ncbi:hypothetical protein EYY20_13150, partial [Escherichia coli]
TQQVRTQGPIRHADCRQRKLADFLCTGGIIQGLIRRAKRRIRHGARLIYVYHIKSSGTLKSAYGSSSSCSSALSALCNTILLASR